HLQGRPLAPRVNRAYAELKLSGMVDSIAARVQDARDRPTRLLLRLLEDELMRRESESIDRSLHRARFDEACDLRDFDFSYNPEIPGRACGSWPVAASSKSARGSCCAVRPAWARRSSLRRCPDLPTTPSRRVHQDQCL